MSVEDVPTPECDKVVAVHERSQAIGEFLEWLSDQGVHRMRYGPVEDRRLCPSDNCDDGKVRWRTRHLIAGIRTTLERGDDCPRCHGEGVVDVEVETWMHDGRSIEALLGEFFGIDLTKVDQEKRAILAALRAANAEKA